MTSRLRLVLIIGALALAGCGDLHSGPIHYAESEALTKDESDNPALKGKTSLKGKEKLQAAIRTRLAELFGPSPQVMHVPPDSGLPLGGRRLADRYREGETSRDLYVTRLDPVSWTTVMDPETSKPASGRGRGGYALYREHCLHCHGVSGDGAGPTGPFLYPRPRDYRKGIFKFTSTNTGAKPTRDDLRKTLRLGIPGTSMPAFDAMMAPEDIEQVIDYVIFLSARGETELGLIEEAALADENDPDPLPAETARELAQSVFNKWKDAKEQVLDPPVSRTASTPESIARGKQMFLGRTSQKLECSGCHGPKAHGDGPSFVDQDVFDRVVFSLEGAGTMNWQTPEVDRNVEQAARERYEQLRDAALAQAHSHGSEAHAGPEATGLPPIDEYVKRVMATWKDGSFDDWGQPLRPADLNKGVYKGGRRPIDLYWRIAKGINGAKMPAHSSALKPEEIWDLVNFILTLPQEPRLLEDATAPVTAPTRAVARR